MVAGLAWQIRDGVARGDRLQSAAADEVQAEGKEPAAGENEFADERWQVCSLLQRTEIHRTRRMIVIESLPGETGGGEMFKQRLVEPGSADSGLRLREGKQSERADEVQPGTTAKCVRVEVASDNGGAWRQAIEQKLHLHAPAARGAEDFKMSIGDRQHTA